MINVQDFLLKNNIELGTYALVTYDNKTEPIWFTKYNFGEGDWFLESPCKLREVMKTKGTVEDFCKEYVNSISLEKGVKKEDFIKEFIVPMIIDGILYEIENFQHSPYLPIEVEDIRIISERECLEYILKQQ